MKPHKHAALIHAWAEGARIKERTVGGAEWYSPNFGTPEWDNEDWEFALDDTPEPAPEPSPYQHLIDAAKAGKVIQMRNLAFTNRWHDAQPDYTLPPEFYRIKPDTIRYRVALFKTDGSGWTMTANTESAARAHESCTNFVEWLTEWKEVEV